MTFYLKAESKLPEMIDVDLQLFLIKRLLFGSFDLVAVNWKCM